jgi:Zn finger protein HypA/HybF involved in hydrogenase expression
MARATVRADGSAVADRHETVEIDRTDEPYRWRCPNGHTSWDKTNNHIWCPSCKRAADHGADVEAEHWAVVDEKAKEAIPYAAVEIVGGR